MTHIPSVREVFSDEDDAPSISIELDTPGLVPTEVSASSVSSATLVCPRCGAPVAGEDHACVHCAAPLHQHFAPMPPAWLATLPPRFPEPPVPIASSPVTRTDKMSDALGVIPYDFWKRIALYPFLAAFLGNGCTCRGLSFGMNAMLIGLGVFGIVGVIASVRSQRSL